MARITRREWHQLAAAGLVGAMTRGASAQAGASGGTKVPPSNAAAAPSTAPGAPYKGVLFGAQSYSFRDRPLDAAIQAMASLGLTSCELWQGHVEPRGLSREELRKWRESGPLDHFAKIGEQFKSAGIRVATYDYSFKDHFSDGEIARGFEMAKALGASAMTASANTNVVARVAPLAEKHGMRVGMHNHSRVDPNEFATPDNFADAMRLGKHIAVTLDIGHFTAANFDAVDYLRRNRQAVIGLHLKDRKRDQGPNMPFGEGDTPIGPVLRLLRDERITIPANIEYEYKGGDTVEEVRRCLEYCRRQLDS